jgi:alanyl-tRNA synthetase
MTPEQIGEVEKICQQVISEAQVVHDQLAPLQQAREVNGLRAMFGETYPDPVRVLSVGAPINDVLADPASDLAVNHSLEFCGGTHVKNSKDIGEFTILSEEAIAKGIRRIVAVTGHEARKAFALADEYDQLVHDRMTAKEVGAMSHMIGIVPMPAVRKEAIRAKLKALSKQHAEIIKARRKELAGNAKSRAQELIDTAAGPVVVEILNVGANTKAMSEALKMLKTSVPEVAFMFFGVEEGSIAYCCQVPKALTEKGLKAGDWVKAVNNLLGGRGGGKDLVAQGSATDDSKADAAVQVATEFAAKFLA